MRKFLLLPALLVGIPLASCQSERTTPGGAITPFFSFIEKAYPVKVASVTVEERPWVVERPARLEVFEQGVIRAEWDARAKQVFVKADQEVVAGTVLIKVEHERTALEIEKKRAEIKEAEAQIKLDKAAPAGGPGETASPPVEEKVAATEARIERLKAEIAQLESDQEKTEITSPISGIVTKKSVVEGMAINKGDELYTIVRINPIAVVFDLPPEQIGAAGAIEEVRTLFPPLEDRSIAPAQVAVAPERGPGGGIGVRATMTNDGHRFKAGLEGHVKLITTRRLQILKVPDTAILEAGGKKWLYRVTDDLAHQVEVEIGEKNSGLTEITRGLTLADQIVVEGQKDLREGVAVQIKAP